MSVCEPHDLTDLTYHTSDIIVAALIAALVAAITLFRHQQHELDLAMDAGHHGAVWRRPRAGHS